MTEQQQKLYDKLLKKVNEYCLGQAAEDVIAAIDDLVENYETPNFIEIDNFLVRTNLIQTVQLCKNYYGDEYILVVYDSTEGEKIFNSKVDKTSNVILKKYNELKEVLK